MSRRKTDGERIAQRMAENWPISGAHVGATAREIDRIIKKRMAEAWEDGWFDRDCLEADWHQNPYRTKKKETKPRFSLSES